MMDAARWIGANLNHQPALAAVHDDGFGHLLAGFLVGRQLACRAVCLRLLDLQLYILIPSQGSALAGIPRSRNL